MNNISKIIRHPLGRLVLLSAFCLLATAIRSIQHDNMVYLFLNWNLFLAWIPLMIVKVWARYSVTTNPLKSYSILFFFAWLLFFPNAPYIITDLIHLNKRLVTSWIDPLILFTYAFTGLILGLYSLRVVHQQLASYFTHFLTWFCLTLAMFISGYGIYLGRVQRWNSWDIITKPMSLIRDAISQSTNPMAIQMTFAYSSMLILVYLVIHSSLNHERK